MKPSEFVNTYLEYAQDTEAYTGISAVFTLAQAALESGWGRSAVGNMFFGVKASASTPINKKQLLTTTEIFSNPNAKFPQVISITPIKGGKYKYIVKDWFRKYDTPEESFTDHAKFFLTNKRYAKALEVKDDPYKFADEVAKAGYATAPDYASVLKGVIKTIEKHLP
ncbi:MAG: glucosaminidase domain-containing protein [Dysgonomonas sp.]